MPKVEIRGWLSRSRYVVRCLHRELCVRLEGKTRQSSNEVEFSVLLVHQLVPKNISKLSAFPHILYKPLDDDSATRSGDLPPWDIQDDGESLAHRVFPFECRRLWVLQQLSRCLSKQPQHLWDDPIMRATSPLIAVSSSTRTRMECGAGSPFDVYTSEPLNFGECTCVMVHSHEETSWLC